MWDYEIPREFYILSGAHQMEPPSPLISWVNPFPSRFINTTACFPRKVSYFRESRMSPWKKWSWRSPSFDRFPFLLYVHFYSFTAAGIWDEIKVNELPDWDRAWSDGTKAANWGSRKGSLRVFVFVVVVFFAVIHPTFKHAPWKESTIKRSVDDLKLFDDQRRKSDRIIYFCHRRGVDFAS